MAKIAARAVLNLGLKTYGQLPDRLIFGRDVTNLDFSPLSILDSKRDFKFFDRRVKASQFKINTSSGRISAAVATSNSVTAKIVLSKETFANDMYTPPLFYSSNLVCNRNFIGQSAVIDFHGGFIGNYKGPGPIFTVDSQGSAGDFLSPGTKLMVSKTGMVHKYTEQGAFDTLYYPPGSVARDFVNTGYNLAGYPIIVGWGPSSAIMKYPYNELLFPTASDIGTTTIGTPGRWANIKFAHFIHQDATYIIFFQYNNSSGTVGVFDGSLTGPPDKYEIVAIRKSDGFQFNVPMVLTVGPTGGTSPVFKSVTTTEATPQKACVYLLLQGQHAQSKYMHLSKIIGNTVTSVGSNQYYTNYTYSEIMGTQLMENKNASFSTHWKAYYPMAGYNACSSNENALTLQLVRFNKQLTTNVAITPCTLSGIPTEYCSANGDGTKLRCCNTTKEWNYSAYDITFAQEIYDGTDQYIAYWIGRTRNIMTTPDVDANSYSEMSDTQYRWFLVFKVDPTDDTKLTYQSCVPEFKFAKPMNCYVTSPDNKYIVMANQDNVYCLSWSSQTKSFICTDIIALPGVVSMGMDENQTTAKCTVWAEVVNDINNPDECNSTVYQIDFGNYEDVDLRYWNGTAFVTDFGFSSLTLSKDGNGNYLNQTATFDIRVKNKVDEVETEFVTGKNVRLKISGVRETDGVSFVGNDVGVPLQKTVVTTNGWLTVTFNFKYPLVGMKINAEIVP